MSESVTLSRQFLSDTGGWKEMKAARSLHAAGRVEEASYRQGILEGFVRDQGKRFRVRVEIRTRIDVENHCPCFRARRDGIICAHALAVGLEVLEPTAGTPSEQSTHSPEARNAAVEGHSSEATATRVPPSPDWPAVAAEGSDDAEAAALHLVLAPNIADAWNKGRITLGVEVESGGQRRLLRSLPASTRLFLDAGDTALYEVLQKVSPEAVPGMLSISCLDLARVFAAIPGHPRLTLGKRNPLQIGHRPFRPCLRRGKGLRFQVDWPRGVEEVIPLVAKGGTSWAMVDGKLLLPVAPGLDPSWGAVLEGGLTLDPADFLRAFPELRQHFEIDALDIVRPQASVGLELEGSLNHLEAKLSFHYGEPGLPGGRIVPATLDRPALEEVDGALHLADANTESAAIRELESTGFSRRGSGGTWVLKDKAAILQFLAHGYAAFADRFQITTGERFQHAMTQVEPIETRLEFRRGGEDWFAMEIGFGTGSGESVSRAEIEHLLRMGQAGKTLPNGKTAVLSGAFAEQFHEILGDCEPRQMQPGNYRIDQAHAGYLRETARDFGFAASGDLPWRTTGEGLEFYELSPALESCLRPYQRTGLEWMQGLASRGMGGILADDMGLGKTLQALSLLYSIGGTSLVVCPSSLVFNWIAEAEKFTPDLRAVAIEGPDRARLLAENEDADVFVTSYALLRRDEEVWQGREFDVVLLDEAQHIKNPEAQTSRAAHRLRGSYRFALTGTPIENSVRDLWSIFQFALPGYLGSRRDFSERFEKPLAATDPPSGVRDRLSRRLRPVVLRRLKSEVAQDLPEKIEQVIYCDLKPKQREVYETLLRESRAAILEAEGGKQRMLALTTLLRLRQTCCDLRLLGLSDLKEEEASVKAEILSELLDEAMEGGHRVLVFSQFVEMLQILVPELASKGIDFCYLDGRTRDRGEVVRRFQENEIPVFLISLKAGGVGLNLTAADTVIHVDPWWNPAVEDQATDRAHRIGQERVVTSYKLITRGTVEEKLLALQNRKREMAGELLADAGEAGMSEGELMSLFD